MPSPSPSPGKPRASPAKNAKVRKVSSPRKVSHRYWTRSASGKVAQAVEEIEWRTAAGTSKDETVRGRDVDGGGNADALMEDAIPDVPPIPRIVMDAMGDEANVPHVGGVPAMKEAEGSTVRDDNLLDPGDIEQRTTTLSNSSGFPLQNMTVPAGSLEPSLSLQSSSVDTQSVESVAPYGFGQHLTEQPDHMDVRDAMPTIPYSPELQPVSSTGTFQPGSGWPIAPRGSVPLPEHHHPVVEQNESLSIFGNTTKITYAKCHHAPIDPEVVLPSSTTVLGLTPLKNPALMDSSDKAWRKQSAYTRISPEILKPAVHDIPAATTLSFNTSHFTSIVDSLPTFSSFQLNQIEPTTSLETTLPRPKTEPCSCKGCHHKTKPQFRLEDDPSSDEYDHDVRADFVPNKPRDSTAKDTVFCDDCYCSGAKDGRCGIMPTSDSELFVPMRFSSEFAAFKRNQGIGDCVRERQGVGATKDQVFRDEKTAGTVLAHEFVIQPGGQEGTNSLVPPVLVDYHSCRHDLPCEHSTCFLSVTTNLVDDPVDYSALSIAPRQYSVTDALTTQLVLDKIVAAMLPRSEPTEIWGAPTSIQNDAQHLRTSLFGMGPVVSSLADAGNEKGMDMSAHVNADGKNSLQATVEDTGNEASSTLFTAPSSHIGYLPSGTSSEGPHSHTSENARPPSRKRSPALSLTASNFASMPPPLPPPTLNTQIKPATLSQRQDTPIPDAYHPIFSSSFATGSAFPPRMSAERSSSFESSWSMGYVTADGSGSGGGGIRRRVVSGAGAEQSFDSVVSSAVSNAATAGSSARSGGSGSGIPGLELLEFSPVGLGGMNAGMIGERRREAEGNNGHLVVASNWQMEVDSDTNVDMDENNRSRAVSVVSEEE